MCLIYVNPSNCQYLVCRHFQMYQSGKQNNILLYTDEYLPSGNQFYHG